MIGIAGRARPRARRTEFSRGSCAERPPAGLPRPIPRAPRPSAPVEAPRPIGRPRCLRGLTAPTDEWGTKAAGCSTDAITSASMHSSVEEAWNDSTSNLFLTRPSAQNTSLKRFSVQATRGATTTRNHHAQARQQTNSGVETKTHRTREHTEKHVNFPEQARFGRFRCCNLFGR